MKELTIEEKATRYDEVIKRAESLYKVSEPISGCNVIIETLFPEFKRSNDEQIRKALIEGFKVMKDNSYVGCTFSNYNIPVADIIAWLEKQGEQKYIPKYKIGDYVKNTNYKGEPIYEIVYMDKECYICEYRGKELMGDKAVMHFSFDNPYLRLVQKPADKIEPKFKVEEGKWYVCISQFCNCIEGRVYKATSDNRIMDDFGTEYDMHSDAYQYFRLWTIQDAKDGDVLVASDGSIFLFAGIVDCACKYHVALTIDNVVKFNEGLEHYWEVSGAVHPATKEQRDILFQKIKEAGYEWDAEKKELKTIEKKPDKWEPQTGDTFRKKGTTSPTYHLCNKREDGITFGFVENREVGIAGGEITIFALKQDYELVERPKSI